MIDGIEVNIVMNRIHNDDKITLNELKGAKIILKESKNRIYLIKDDITRG